jgi:hypothetical protein
LPSAVYFVLPFLVESPPEELVGEFALPEEWFWL